MSDFVLNGVNYVGNFELPPGLSRLGRNPTNDFRVGDASISSFHCELETSRESVVVRDLGSTNGTFIDDQPVVEGELRVGHSLKLGGVTFTLAAREEVQAYTPIQQTRIPLADGFAACLNHREAHARYECGKCAGAYCNACVRILRRTGGGDLVFCPNCSGACVALAGVPLVERNGATTFLGRLTQTMKLRR